MIALYGFYHKCLIGLEGSFKGLIEGLLQAFRDYSLVSGPIIRIRLECVALYF